MADLKISQLPNASTPLAGTEVLPIVQSGVTDKVTVDNLLARLTAAPPAIGTTTPAAGSFTTLAASGSVTLGDASTDTLNIGNGGIIKDSSGNVGIGGSSAGHKLDVQGTSSAVARFYQATAATNTDVYVNNVGSANNFLISRRSNGESWFYNSGTDPFVFYTNSVGRFTVDGSGNVLSISGTGGLGYGAGAGGTVTQATNKTTAVTLNKPTGQITMNNAALASGAFATFQLTNSVIALADSVFVDIKNPVSGLANYRIQAGDIGTGYCWISLQNVSAGSLSDAVVVSFKVFRGATS